MLGCPCFPRGVRVPLGSPAGRHGCSPAPAPSPASPESPTLLNGHLKGNETEMATGRQGHRHTPWLCFTPFLGGQLPIWVPALRKTLTTCRNWLHCSAQGSWPLYPKLAPISGSPESPRHWSSQEAFPFTLCQWSIKPNNPHMDVTHTIPMQQTPTWHKSKHQSSWQHLHGLAPLLP